jgi:hypothetical protein
MMLEDELPRAGFRSYEKGMRLREIVDWRTFTALDLD